MILAVRSATEEDVDAIRAVGAATVPATYAFAGHGPEALRGVVRVNSHRLRRRRPTLAGGGHRSWKRAVCDVPSVRVTVSCRQVPTHALSVFHT